MLLKCEKGKHLTASEKIAIDYINQNTDKIMDMSIDEIAEHAFVSTATISRAIRKCGVKKLPDVRHRLAVKEIAKKNFVANSIMENTYEECTSAIERIDTTSILKMVENIRSAKRIFILAQGYTQLAALELESQLRLQGYISTVEWDRNVFMEMERIARPGDLIIAYSVACTNEFLVEGVRMAKNNGAAIVSCCCKEKTQLEELADVTIVAGCPPHLVQKNGVGSISLLGLHIISRIVSEFLIVE